MMIRSMLLASLLTMGDTVGTGTGDADPFTPRVLAAGLPAGAGPCLAMLAESPPPSEPARIKRFGDDILCYAGRIEQEDVDQMLAQLQSIPTSTPLYLMMHSQGGSVEASLEGAKALSGYHVTMVAGLLCASSCANYFFLPAQRRIILADSMVVFHGGISPGLREVLQRQLDHERKKRSPDQERIGWMERNIAGLPGLTARQDELLERSGIQSTFFNAFDEIKARPRRLWSQDCARQRKAAMIVLSQDVLAAQGATIDVNLGPDNASELAALLDQVGGKGEICWWDSPWPSGAR